MKALSEKTISEQMAGRNALQRKAAEDAVEVINDYIKKVPNCTALVLPLFTANAALEIHVQVMALDGALLFESIEDPLAFPSELLAAKLAVIS